MPATKDMNYVPPVSTTGTSPGTSKQAADASDARLAKDELILRVSIFSRHRPDKLLQVRPACSSLHHLGRPAEHDAPYLGTSRSCSSES